MHMKRNEEKEEFYITITIEQLERANSEYLVGTRMDTGEEVRVKLLQDDELKKYGFNPINKGKSSYIRPEIVDILEGNGTGQKPHQTLEKFKSLHSDDFKSISNVHVPQRLVVKVDTCIRMPDGAIGSRWVTLLNGAGTKPLAMDMDKFIIASGLYGNGLYLNMIRPNKYKVPKNLFVEALNAGKAIASTPKNFMSDLSAAIDHAINMRSIGGIPLVHIQCFDKDSNIVKLRLKNKKGDKEYLSNDFVVRLSNQGADGEWVDFKTSEEAIDNLRKTHNGGVLRTFLVSNPDSKITIMPAGSFIIGPNVRNRILKDFNQNEKITDVRFSPFEIETGGEYPERGYSKGQFSVRRGVRNQDAHYVTDISITNPQADSISIVDIARFKLGLFRKKQQPAKKRALAST